MNRSLLLLTLLLCASAASCSTAPRAGRDRIAGFSASAYEKALDANTGTVKIYKDLETTALVTATLRAHSFREAFIDEYSRRFVLDEAARTQFRQDELATWSQSHEVLITIYTPQRRLNDLDAGRSVWKVRLYDESGRSVDSASIKRLDRSDRTVKGFYPYVNDWSRTYLARFPRGTISDTPSTITLQIAGAYGTGDVVFRVENEPSPDAS